MAPKSFKYFSLLFLALLLAQSTTTEARKFIGVNSFCRTSSNMRLCTKMVNGATNMHDASKNAILATLDFAKKIPPMIRLVDPLIVNLEKQSQDDIKSVCKENFDNIIDSLQESLHALEDNDQGTVLSQLSASAMSDCEDALKEFGFSNFPLKKVQEHLFKEVDNCLAVVQQI